MGRIWKEHSANVQQRFNERIHQVLIWENEVESRSVCLNGSTNDVIEPIISSTLILEPGSLTSDDELVRRIRFLRRVSLR